MRINATVVYIVAGLVLLLSPMLLVAQTSGQFAVAQPPQTPFLPTQGPAIATRAPFHGLPAGSGPIVIVQPQTQFPVRNPFFNPGQVFTPGQVFAPTQAVIPNQVFAPTQVFVPNQVFAPNQAVIPNQFVLPMGPTQLLLPGQTVIPSTTMQTPFTFSQPAFAFQSPAQAQPAAPQQGMSRADLLRQFGDPTVSIVTSTSETLYFRDGTKVTLQNDKVVGSK